MAELVKNVSTRVRVITRSGVIQLRSSLFLKDIELRFGQVSRAGFRSRDVRVNDEFVIVVRIEKGDRLKTSMILSYNGMESVAGKHKNKKKRDGGAS